MTKKFCLNVFETNRNAIMEIYPDLTYDWSHLQPKWCHGVTPGCEGVFALNEQRFSKTNSTEQRDQKEQPRSVQSIDAAV